MSDVKKVVQFRLKKSEETFAEAKFLAEKAHWNGVVNRLYYAAFYAITAYLHQENVFTKTHNGVKSKFHELLLKTGILSERFGDIYTDLFSNRQDGDYEDFMVFTKEEIEPFIEETESLIADIKKLII